MNKDKTFAIEVDGATITIMPRRYHANYHRDYFKAPRMYVRVEDESIMDNLANRKRRPYNVYKSMIRASGVSEILDVTKLQWSQHAGCSCPCSPGFILPHVSIDNPETGESFRNYDVWVALHGAPAVDERKAPRILVGA